MIVKHAQIMGAPYIVVINSEQVLALAVQRYAHNEYATGSGITF
ncbi:hypothetical protein [Thalassotalea maritima]